MMINDNSDGAANRVMGRLTYLICVLIVIFA
jgi:hypothetical protein